MIPHRTEIKKLIAAKPVVKLDPKARDVSGGTSHKAGVVPFMRTKNGEWRFYVMKPKMRHPKLGEPPFQVCKGSRMICDNDNWRDASPSEVKYGKEGLETVIETALREGAEEIGLRLGNIVALADAGVVSFTAASSGKTKYMHLFAAEVKAENDFDVPDTILASTDSCRWCTLEEYTKVGRDDHLAILRGLADLLDAYEW